jgi:hypothetical protein
MSLSGFVRMNLWGARLVAFRVTRVDAAFLRNNLGSAPIPPHSKASRTTRIFPGVFAMAFAAVRNLAASFAVVLALGSGAASAATVLSFDRASFLGANGTSSQSVTQDGIGLTIESVGGTLHFNNRGVGVAGGTSNNRLGAGEAIDFRFVPTVSILSSVIFEAGTGEDTVSILDASNAVLASFAVPQTSTLFTAALTGVSGNFFRFVSTNNGNLPGVRISSVTVAVVPVPASLGLMALGLGAMGIAARRTRSMKRA